MAPHTLTPPHTPSPTPVHMLRSWLRLYPVGMLVLWSLTLYVTVVSLATLWQALAFRLAGGAITGGGKESDPLYELGTSLGFWGVIYFGLNFMLATRWRWVETLFGGLDRVYQAHNLVGRLAMSLLVLHGGILVFQALPDRALLGIYLLPGVDWGYTTGVAGLVLLVLLVFLTIWAKLPYARWLASHKWMGVPYILGGMHAILLQGDWYMITITAMGSYAWLYMLVWYPWRGARRGALAEVRVRSQVTELQVRLDQPVPSQPGQFVFLAIQGATGRIEPEVHPFSISGRPDAQTIRISAKALGDYTRTLPQACPGDRVALWGPYGGFGKTYLGQGGDLVWVAGGIGVTPFLDLLRHELQQGTSCDRRIAFVWSVARAEDAVYQDEIEAACAQLPQIAFHLHITATDGLLTAKKLASLRGGQGAEGASFMLCGPPTMMHALRSQLRALGVPGVAIVMEEFGLRP